ncbi:WD40/YVTN/BNR-like repeat-containing protein [Salarchaeum japonicum]|uniref:WD40/YVTN/BNR-like repeat-containing protein n=1 Tax=Salarchaeum japonicum TaxID=555573 RepID=UPI003C70C628
MFAALSDRVLSLSNGVTEFLVSEDVQCVATGELGAFAGTDDAVYRIRDGETERVFEPDAEFVTALCVTPEFVFAGTEPSRVYRSRDGTTWTECTGLTALDSSGEWSFPPRPDTHHVRWIQSVPGSELLYVAVEAGALVRTPDAGESWTDRVSEHPFDTHTMAVPASNPERAYAAAGDGFYVTPDGGESWMPRESGLSKTYCWSVAVRDDDGNALAVSSANGPRSAHTPETADSTVSFWDDGWHEWTDGLPDRLLAPSLLATSDGWYALTDGALYTAAARGDRWQAVREWDAPRQRPNGLVH